MDKKPNRIPFSKKGLLTPKTRKEEIIVNRMFIREFSQMGAFDRVALLRKEGWTVLVKKVPSFIWEIDARRET
jgi:hypothetical protein